MKLRNFMYATMIACAFASCSNDDVIENGPDAKGDASLTIGLGVKSTKADIAAGTETAVNDINIFLLEQETNTVISRVYLTSEIKSEYTYTFDNLEVGQKLYCVGFANFSKEMTSVPTSEVINVSGNIEGTSLPMHGLSGDVTIAAGDKNETTLTLVRDLARVELVDLTLDMSQQGDENAFTAGTFKFDFISASVNMAPESSTVTFAKRGENSERSYAVGDKFVGGLTGWEWNSLSNDEQNNSYIVANTTEDFATYIMGTTTSAVSVTKPSSIVFYVLPNEATKEGGEYSNDNPTAFTLNGTMEVEGAVRDGQTIKNTYNSFYNIEIGKDGAITGQDAGAGILPNKNYKISLAVAGIGGGIGGLRPSLKVKTVVEDWDEVTQVTPVK
ncbi:hypothetical protein [Parabacteroides hominis]|uniref:Major fimbrial subunit protein N-terminal domain-containing protein n=1 Tax=Parabacteroides hominis TaxID=2763057 RepID=A0ABR7DPC5_9BACT|nr:hypothetical protein [Parabacteroides hominis]MBC5633289.1 hypothetical protein [Parabacteroides hominis]